MKTAITSLALLTPRSVADALRMLRDESGAIPLAGATDLYVSLNFGTLEARRFVNIWGLRPLARIAMVENTLSIGALATYTDLLKSRLVRRHLPMLVQAAQEVGGLQIQNRGTIGGNIANASPAGDTLPVLAAADAAIVLKSMAGERRVPFADFYTGYRKSMRRHDELITAVEIAPIEGQQWFRKVGTRAAQAISKVVMAAVRSSRPRIAIGSVGPTVVRARLTERALGTAVPLDEAARILEGEIAPIDDLRSTAAYRRAVASNLLRKFWADTAAK